MCIRDRNKSGLIESGLNMTLGKGTYARLPTEVYRSPYKPRSRSAPVRRTSAIANQATDRIMDNMERQLTRIENNIAAVRHSTAVQRGAATRIQSAVRGAQAKKEMRN